METKRVLVVATMRTIFFATRTFQATLIASPDTLKLPNVEKKASGLV